MKLELWKQFILALWFLYASYSFYQGYIQCRYKRNPVGYTFRYYPLGAFVWGDAFILGVFWMIVTSSIFILNDWVLFLLIYSIFWVVRGIGETIYWIGQQFSHKIRHPHTRLPGQYLFGDDSIWFVYQVVAQCIAIVATISSLYFARLWLTML